MAGNDREQDLTEQATPFKLREARKRGQVAKSMEFTGWMLLVAAAAFACVFGPRLLKGELELGQALFSQAGHINLDPHSATRLFAATLLHLLANFWFLIAVLLGAGLFANFIQVGPVFSWTPLKPDFNRINPAAGFKKLFNKRILFELAKTLLKITAAAIIVGTYINRELAHLLSLLQTDVEAQLPRLMAAILKLASWLLAAWALLALLDFAFIKWEFGRNMRMSRREVRDEVKTREGDPKIKSKIRELQREAATRGASIGRIAEADVLITNPTHLSVAIQYRRGAMPAPVVIAKGAGDMALRMRVKARQCRVPIIENKALARTLFKRVRIDETIVPETYAQVARILTQIYRARGAAG